MLHARPDWNDRIVDLDGRIPGNEPVLLIRGQDATAPETARFWATRSEWLGADPRCVTLVRLWADRIEAYQEETGKRKVADMPPGPIDRLAPTTTPPQWMSDEDGEHYCAVGVYHRSPENLVRFAIETADLTGRPLEDTLNEALAASWEISEGTDDVGEALADDASFIWRFPAADAGWPGDHVPDPARVVPVTLITLV